MTTAVGKRADTIRRWAWEDPQARVDEGLERLHGLADSGEADGDEQAQREIGDAARMLSRLKGTLVHDVTGIFDQMEPQ
jgi:hypothetical protein